MSDTVKDIMTMDVEKINLSQTVFEAAKLMREKAFGCLVIVDDGKTVGIITERDLVRRVVAENLDATKVKVKEVMSKPIITIEPDATVRHAAAMMIENKIRRLPVVENSKLVGIITSTDLAKYFASRRRAFGALMSLEDMPRVGESKPACQFFKQDPYVSSMQVWKVCGTCYWQMDERCMWERVGLLKHLVSPSDS